MNEKLYRKIQSMTLTEIYAAMYTDPLTRVQNRRAFDEAVAEGAHDQVAIIDLDSLKYLNDETPGGHRTGDEFLASLAHTLTRVFGDDVVYRLSGDEFAVLGDNKLALAGLLDKARSYFPGFSFGVGTTVETADRALRVEKRKREQLGLRAARGERPPWMDKTKKVV